MKANWWQHLKMTAVKYSFLTRTYINTKFEVVKHTEGGGGVQTYQPREEEEIFIFQFSFISMKTRNKKKSNLLWKFRSIQNMKEKWRKQKIELTADTMPQVLWWCKQWLHGISKWWTTYIYIFNVYIAIKLSYLYGLLSNGTWRLCCRSLFKVLQPIKFQMLFKQIYNELWANNYKICTNIQQKKKKKQFWFNFN